MEGHLLIGQVGKPHGVAGEVYVVVISDDPQRFATGARVIHESGRELEIVASRTHNQRLLVSFAGVGSRNEADAIRGPLYAPTDAPRRELEPDEYWSEDLIGCAVVGVDGGALGVVSDIVSTSAQELLMIDGKHLVPLVKAIVVSIDLERRLIVLDPPEGLLA